jgi:hypothetical protein
MNDADNTQSLLDRACAYCLDQKHVARQIVLSIAVVGGAFGSALLRLSTGAFVAIFILLLVFVEAVRWLLAQRCDSYRNSKRH